MCLPGVLGTRGPMAHEGQDSGGGNRNPHISHEICYETDKKARQGSPGPSDHLVPREKQGPLQGCARLMSRESNLTRL